ncbi:MAG: hypothetical protein UW09_C0003G0211 [candidate division TM6 bacterium GW2011_GWF2_43_87]|nr:MAG: hypothetical protein UW09_C0003G0211 [candidate division TM6 bacterium GW2011_GWF2_43_87]
MVCYVLGNVQRRELKRKGTFFMCQFFLWMFSLVICVFVSYQQASSGLINQPDKDGWLPLVKATFIGDFTQVKELIENKGANINAFGGCPTEWNFPEYIVNRGPEKWAPVHAAAYRGFVDILKYLVSKGADIDSHTTLNNLSVLGLAIEYSLFDKQSALDMVVFFLSHKPPNRVPMDDKFFMISGGPSYPLFIFLQGKQILVFNQGAKSAYLSGFTTPGFRAAALGLDEILSKLFSAYPSSTFLHFKYRDYLGLNVLGNAVLSGNIKAVKVALNAEKSLNESISLAQAFSWSFSSATEGIKVVPLAVAAYVGNVEIFRLVAQDSNHLAEFGIKSGCIGYLPIHIASAFGKADVLNELLLYPEGEKTLSMLSDNELSPLHLAALKTQPAALKALIVRDKKGNLIHQKGYKGRNVWHFAVFGACKINEFEFYRPLTECAKVFNELFSHEEARKIMNDFDDFGYTPLHWALYGGIDLSLIKILLSDGKDAALNKKSTTLEMEKSPLELFTMVYKKSASSLKVPGAVRLFSSMGPDLNVVPFEPSKRIDFLYQFLYDFPNEKRGALGKAAYDGNLNEVKKCVDRGDNINELTICPLEWPGDTDSPHPLTPESWAPIHMASFKGHLDVVKYLVANGADINKKTSRYSCTAVSLAVEYSKVDPKKSSQIVTFLLDNKALPFTPMLDFHIDEAMAVFFSNRKPYNITLPILRAARLGNREVVEKLWPLTEKEKKFLVMGCDTLEGTLLFYAILSGNLELVKFVLAKEVEVGITSEIQPPLEVLLPPGLGLWLSQNIPLSALCAAAFRGDDAIFDTVSKSANHSSEFLKASGENEYLPIHVAAARGNVNIIHKIAKDSMGKATLSKLNKTAFSVDYENRVSPVHLAASEGHYDAIKALGSYDNKGDILEKISSWSYTVWHFAILGICKNKISSPDKVLRALGDFKECRNIINKPDFYGHSPLHWAIYSGLDISLIDLLLSSGANPFAVCSPLNTSPILIKDSDGNLVNVNVPTTPLIFLNILRWAGGFLTGPCKFGLAWPPDSTWDKLKQLLIDSKNREINNLARALKAIAKA